MKSAVSGSFARMASPLRCTTFGGTNEIAEPPQSQAYRRAFLLDTEQIEAFRAYECVGDERSDLLGSERAQPAKLIFRLARRTHDEIDPSDDRSTDDLGDCSV